MNKIFVIIGKTGAGKSTLCKKLSSDTHYTLLSFAKAGKEFAKDRGYTHIRKCFYDLGEDVFKREFTEYFSKIIDAELKKTNTVLIDGLYVESIAIRLKECYDAKIIYIDVPIEICFQRISIRDNLKAEKVEEEYASKEALKKYLGSDVLLNLSDIVISGQSEPDHVFNEVCKFIEQQ